ncbi:MAG: alpha/beta hydrolase [Acidimicrobiales bacterium]|nr:alpha/beta hydrolase [Acidimicrobiales bacterium]
MSAGIVNANGIDLWYERLGEEDGPPLLLVNGLGGQAIGWPEEFCWGFVDRGFHVIRFDNRDAGLSQFFDAEVDITAALPAFLDGGEIPAPYRLQDMAADTIALLDALDVPTAHVLGASLGGMVAQLLAIEHPARVASLTSLMSTTGDRALLVPEPDVLAMLLRPVPTDVESAVASALAWSELVDSPEHRDPEAVEAFARRAWARCPRRDGAARQLLAIAASPSREEQLARLEVATLVIHGSADRLIRPEGGQRTAALVAGAELLELEGMGHDLPPVYWAPIIEAVTRLAVRAGT